jgi:AraC-like DNA-binding protein
MLRAIHVRLYVNFMKSRGYDAAAVLEGSGIREPQLADPRFLVDVSQCHAVASNMLNLRGPGGLGLEIGAAMKLSDLGIVGYAMASSGTLGQAINIWMQYGISAVGAPFSLTPIAPRANGTWGVTASAHGYSQSLVRFYFEEALGMGSNFGEMLTGKPFTFREITCAYPAPPYWRDYEKRLGCKPAFNEMTTRALVQSPTLDDPVQTGDREVRELCIRHCTHLVQQINRTSALSLRLRDVLMHCGMIPNLDHAASLLNTSSRTLRRHLRREGTTFQRVLDDLRRDLSREYLASGVMAIKEIAYLLGFASSAGFCRAYKAWTGETVGTFCARSVSHQSRGPDASRR